MARTGGKRRTARKKKGWKVSPPASRVCPADPAFAWLAAEGPEEGRALVRVAPLGAERRAREGVLIGLAHVGVVRTRERREPLLRAARRVVIDFLRHVERDVGRRDVNRLALIGE